MAGPAEDAVLVLDQVASVVAATTGGRAPSVTLTSDLAGDLGLDSLAAVELYDRLQETFGVILPEELLATATTPGDWLEAVRSAGGRSVRSPGRPAAAPRPRSRGREWPAAAQTLTEVLAWHVEQHRDRSCIRILHPHDGDAAEDITYGDLNGAARSVACGLLADGLGRGDRVVLMLPTGRDYFVAFLAVLFAGGVPVPIYPAAGAAQLAEHLLRQLHLVEDARPVVLITEPGSVTTTRAAYADVAGLRSVHSTDSLLGVADGGRTLPPIAPGDVALIQYTSGSTGDPRVSCSPTPRCSPTSAPSVGRSV